VVVVFTAGENNAITGLEVGDAGVAPVAISGVLAAHDVTQLEVVGAATAGEYIALIAVGIHIQA
jgi:hypothetical protein